MKFLIQSDYGQSLTVAGSWLRMFFYKDIMEDEQIKSDLIVFQSGGIAMTF